MRLNRNACGHEEKNLILNLEYLVNKSTTENTIYSQNIYTVGRSRMQFELLNRSKDSLLKVKETMLVFITDLWTILMPTQGN